MARKGRPEPGGRRDRGRSAGSVHGRSHRPGRSGRRDVRMADAPTPPDRGRGAGRSRQGHVQSPAQGNGRLRRRQGDQSVPAADTQGPEPPGVSGAQREDRRVHRRRGVSHHRSAGCRGHVRLRDVHPDGHLSPAGDAGDLPSDAGVLPQAGAGDLADDRSDGRGHLDDGGPDRSGLSGPHYELDDSDLPHADRGRRFGAHPVRILRSLHQPCSCRCCTHR